MQESELRRLLSYTDGLRERLADTAKYLRGIAAIVEGLNKGAVDSLEVAIHAVEAVAEDLSEVRAKVVDSSDAVDGAHGHMDGESLSGSPG